MSWRVSVARTLAFSVVYLLATYAGRLTVMDETNLSLVWPAAGVSGVWFLAQYRSRWRALDVSALTAITIMVNVATGTSAALAAWFVAANVVQAGLFAYLMRRWMPYLWATGGTDRLARTRELWLLTAAALASTVGGAFLGPTGLWVISGAYSWPAAAVWLTRNTVSLLLISAVWLTCGHLWRAWHEPGRRASVRACWSVTPLMRRAEYAAVVVLSAVAYVAVFGIAHGLPLAFAVIAITVWAGSRLHTAFMVLHDFIFGSAAVLFTLHGSGPFAQIGSNHVRALVAQLFVGMIAVVGLALALGRDERAVLAGQVRSEQRTAAEQASLMTAIVDSMSEGLTVIDEHGRLLLRNPAVRQLLGGVVSASGQIADPEYYGLCRPDGSPLAPEEMPYRSAFAGTDVRGMDILVRNPGVPHGRILSVSSTALPGDLHGTRCAVTVFHDVTAERRHREELASFAGVVAHDLLNPLATVEGSAELLRDAYADGAPPDEAEVDEALARIGRASRRIRSMVDDLLAYTTARDAELMPTMASLGDVVSDIAIARVDQAQSNGMLAPVFDIGDLHPVYADPVLVRQLLENLISNAIKYTAPGVTPSIRVRSVVAGHRVTVTIDDNGIGIPEGQHGSIFDNFHRAHRTAGYSGTGLGLGICKRIVERHGGTITAAPGPDGAGSRFTFTLPADAAAVPQEASTAAPGSTADPAPLSPPEKRAPAGEVSERRSLPYGASFAHAAHLALDFLHEQMPLSFWAVTRVENGRQTYLYLNADNGYGLRQGDSHPWKDSFCVHMATGEVPPVAVDAQSVSAYAHAGINDLIEIGTYAGAVIAEPDGTLFGAICGLDPHAHNGDPRLAGAEPTLALLGRLLTTALAADRAQERAATELLREQISADTDALTGLPNRRAWDRIVEQTRDRCERLGEPTVIAMLDLDNLKIINDTEGHAAGDACIRAAAEGARRAMRDTDFIARIGGDEFGLVLTRCTPAEAHTVVARIHGELDAAGVAGSIGWAAVTAEEGVSVALDRADSAMYAQKQRRRAASESTAPPQVSSMS